MSNHPEPPASSRGCWWLCNTLLEWGMWSTIREAVNFAYWQRTTCYGRYAPFVVVYTFLTTFLWVWALALNPVLTIGLSLICFAMFRLWYLFNRESILWETLERARARQPTILGSSMELPTGLYAFAFVACCVYVIVTAYFW